MARYCYSTLLFSVCTVLWFLDGLAAAEDDYGDLSWYERVSVFRFPHIAATELGEMQTSILPSVGASKANFVLMEFYAPWCPHCQHFAPEYERLALAAQQADGDIMAAKVDCVRHAETCSEFGVEGYPTLLWGRREDLLSRRGLQKVSGFNGSAESVAEWIEARSPIRLELQGISSMDIAEKLHSERDGSVVTHVPSPQKTAADVWDMQLASVLLIRLSLMNHALSQPRMRTLRDFVHLLSERFPEQLATGSAEQGNRTRSAPCRESLRELHRELGALVDNPGSQELNPDALEARWQFCGTPWNDYGTRGWSSCRGTWPGKRGFTCGLWTLFHATAARGSDETATSDTQMIRDVIAQLFDCEDCRDHFLQIPWNPESTATRSDAQLWWWQAHNQVNSRLEQMEKQNGDGDPASPKIQWPSSTVCPRCHGDSRARSFLQQQRLSHAWDNNEVAVFLHKFYG